jgi:type II secretory pathway pseudopilin PulG
MSVLAIVLIVIAAVLLLLLLGGLVAGRRERRRREAEYDRSIAAADRALEEARAADRGWDRGVLEAAARQALESERPGWEYEELALVLVDDRPGIERDRAHFRATAGHHSLRVILSRTEDGWGLERIE